MVRSCPTCGSTRWRRDGVTGSVVCEEGHVVQDFRTENNELEGPPQYTLQRRAIRRRTNRKKRSTHREFYGGDDAQYLKIQTVQLLLRAQVQALSKLWSLPDAFELVVRDLWTYHLSRCQLPPPPEPSDGNRGKGTSKGTESERSDARGARRPEGPAFDQPDDGFDDANGDGDEDDSASQGDSDTVNLEEQLLDDALRDSEESDHEPGDEHRRGVGESRSPRSVRVADTLMLLATGLWMMRWPLVFSDLETLVNTNQIPFIDYLHSTIIPAAMQQLLNKPWRRAPPSRSPSAILLFSETRLFVRYLDKKFNISLPDANLHPISWRMIKSIGGTPSIHHLVVRLLALLNIEFSRRGGFITKRIKRISGRPSRTNSRRQSQLRGRGRGQSGSRPGSRAGRRSRRTSDADISIESDASERGRGSQSAREGGAAAREGYEDADLAGAEAPDDAFEQQEEDLEPEAEAEAEAQYIYAKFTNTKYDLLMPELVVVSAWVVLMKTMYGLDGEERHILSDSDPMLGLPRGDEWVKHLEEIMHKKVLLGDRAMLIEQSFSTMQDEEIDRYLLMAEQVLLKDRKVTEINETAPFPLSNSPEEPSGAMGISAIKTTTLKPAAHIPPIATADITPLPDPPSPDLLAIGLAAVSGTGLGRGPSRPIIPPAPLSQPKIPLPLMPGEKIASYDPSDTTGTLPSPYLTVITAAAQVAGVEVNDVAEIVRWLELRLKNERKARGLKLVTGHNLQRRSRRLYKKTKGRGDDVTSESDSESKSASRSRSTSRRGSTVGFGKQEVILRRKMMRRMKVNEDLRRVPSREVRLARDAEAAAASAMTRHISSSGVENGRDSESE